jgi:hypothetical protein
MSESVEKSPEAIAAINMMEAKNEKLAKALKEMVNQFAYIPGMADMVHDERSAVMNARDALKFNETGKHV